MNNSKNNIGIIIGVIGFALFITAVTFVFKSGEQATGGQATDGQAASMSDSHGHPVIQADNSKFNGLIGELAPNFSLTDRDGNVYSPENLRGKNVLLFFNEGLMCYPACWNQIVSLADDSRFKDKNTEVFSVVVDAEKDWRQAVNKMPELARAKVLFDSGSAASKQFGVLDLDSSMHKGTFPGHTYVLIDKEGIVRYVFDDPNMAINNDKLIEELNKYAA